MPKLNYCITHNCATEFPVGNIADCVIVSSPPSDELALDGWEFTMSLPVPSPEELAQMDANAEELRNDFIGA
jgi:hypothetical protein